VVNSHAVARGPCEKGLALAQPWQRPPSPVADKLLDGDNAIAPLNIRQASDHEHLAIITTQALADFVIERPSSRLPASGTALGGGGHGEAFAIHGTGPGFAASDRGGSTGLRTLALAQETAVISLRRASGSTPRHLSWPPLRPSSLMMCPRARRRVALAIRVVEFRT
jgi:hypothetical protein